MLKKTIHWLILNQCASGGVLTVPTFRPGLITLVLAKNFSGAEVECEINVCMAARSKRFMHWLLRIIGSAEAAVVTPEPGTPGTRPGWRRNWPGWQIDYRAQMCPAGILGGPPRNFPIPAPHCSFFVYFSRVLFSCGFHLRTRSVDLLISRRPLGYATWVQSLQLLVWPFELRRAWNLLACSDWCDPPQLCFGARRRFIHATSLMPWSLARGCSQTGLGKLGTFTGSLPKENIPLSQKYNRLCKVQSTDYFPFLVFKAKRNFLLAKHEKHRLCAEAGTGFGTRCLGNWLIIFRF